MGREESPISTATGNDRLLLLNTVAYIGEKHNPTSATDCTRNGLPIHASLWRELPPIPSKLYVYSPDATSHDNPRIMCMVDDLILFRIPVGPPSRQAEHLISDYFIYRAGPKRPSLNLLPHPHRCFFYDNQISILRRGDDHYTVAALVPVRSSATEFRLHLVDSTCSSWSTKFLSVESPQREFPVEIPRYRYYMFVIHQTNTVITLGGKGGTMGWVDLWRRIVFCDLLDENLTLRRVPLPVPVKRINSNIENLSHARQSRGIAFVKGSLKFVELEFDLTRLPGIDDETWYPAFRMDGWKITTWSNSKMSDSYDDWLVEYTVDASDFAICKQMKMPELLQQHKLQSLFVSEPTPSLDSDDVVYLIARLKFMHPKSWVLAVDMRNQTVQGVVDSGPQPIKMPRLEGTYCPYSISGRVSHGALDADEVAGEQGEHQED